MQYLLQNRPALSEISKKAINIQIVKSMKSIQHCFAECKSYLYENHLRLHLMCSHTRYSHLIPSLDLWNVLALCGLEVETDGDRLCFSSRLGPLRSLSS